MHHYLRVLEYNKRDHFCNPSEKIKCSTYFLPLCDSCFHMFLRGNFVFGRTTIETKRDSQIDRHNDRRREKLSKLELKDSYIKYI